MALGHYCGLYVLPVPSHRKSDNIVPLKYGTVQAILVDSVAEVTLVQQYVNLESRAIETEYFFPLDARSAVCKFQAVVDGKAIIGIVQENKEARQTYNDAVAKGDGAFLLEQEKPDIFRIKIGNLLPGQEITIHITYVAIMKNEMESLRFVLPTTVAPRYHAPSSYSWVSGSGWWNSDGGSSCTEVENWVPYKLCVHVNIHMLSIIESINSTSHPFDSVVTGTTATVSTVFDQTAMDRDFVVNFKCQDPTQPRCVVEDNNGSKALMVTLMPKFKLQDQPVEAIFLVDRSGSMASYNKIEEAQNAMQLFLRSLPENSFFNVIGFGSHYETLFQSSVKYTDSTMQEAAAAIPLMSANLAGTNILSPLNHVFAQPPIPGYARQLFVLTDGQVSNTEAVCHIVRQNSSSCRTFALGIGNSVSHELVEGIAAAGGGTAVFVIPGEALEAKVMQQLNHSIQPSLQKVKIKWRDESSNQSIPANSSVTETTPKSLLGYVSPKASIPPANPNVYRQAPFNPPAIFDHQRFLMYNMLGNTDELPEKICISADSPDGPLTVELLVDSSKMLHGNLIHTLAARELIKDLENGTSYLHANSVSPSANEIAAEIVGLGKEFNLVSSHTSFIALDEKNKKMVCFASATQEKRDRSAEQGRRRVNINDCMHILVHCDPTEPAKEKPFTPTPPEKSSRETLLARREKDKKRMYALIQLQRANGSFPFTEELCSTIGISMDQVKLLQSSPEYKSLDDYVIATLLALEFLNKVCGEMKDQWQLMATKSSRLVAIYGYLATKFQSEIQSKLNFS